MNWSVCVSGLLGAAPTLPLLANPALSAALLQMLLQNQAKAQQVTLSHQAAVTLPPVLPGVTLSLALLSVPQTLASLVGESSSLGSGAAP